MNLPYLSVIVPVYNAELYLVKCVDSILNQSFIDFELLLVDDGSNDRSASICDAYKKQDLRVRVFHKQNGGVSSARNLGIEKSKGKWIVFIDSDDWCKPNYLEHLFNKACESDFVVTSYTVDGTRDSWDTTLEDAFYTNKDLGVCLAKNLGNISFQVPWGKIFIVDIIKNNNIRFNVNLSQGEDTLFVITYLNFVNSITTSSNQSYCQYRGNTECCSGRILPYDNYLYAIENLYTAICKLSKKIPGLKFDSYLINLISGYFYKIIKSIYVNEKGFACRRKALKKVLKNNVVHNLFDDVDVYPKGKIRKSIDFLYKLKFYSLLTFIFFYLKIDY